jgi:hypothetical protein
MGRRMKLETITLTDSEIAHILTLINQNEEEGWYFGNKSQYWNRSEKIKDKLKQQCKAKWVQGSQFA